MVVLGVLNLFYLVKIKTHGVEKDTQNLQQRLPLARRKGLVRYKKAST
jgi:hypothetical protein